MFACSRTYIGQKKRLGEGGYRLAAGGLEC
jgi:hypothetical protein